MAEPLFSGSMVAIVTPFRDGDIDLDAFGALVEWHVASGTTAIVVAGTTGESATLLPGERQALCRCAIECAKGAALVVMGTGTNATWSTVQQTREAVSWGVDGVLVVTPYYNKPPQEGLFLHYREAARAAAGVPVILYDVPGRTCVSIAEKTVHRLAEVPGIVALKDATHDAARAARLAKETRLTILSGDDSETLPMMRGGAAGVISVVANIVPDKMARLCATQDEALDAQLRPLYEVSMIESNPLATKFALAQMGRLKNELRLPLVPLSEASEPKVSDVLRSLDVL
jgi:4-hydroxy-tetrahydrodipicolinate synthase